MPILSPPQQTHAFRWVVLLLVVGAAATFLPLWPPLVLAAFVAVMARPLMLRIGKATGGRQRAAGALVVLLVMVVFVPIGGALVSLSRGAVDLARSVMASDSARSALVAVASGDQPPPQEGKEGKPGDAEGVGGVLDTLKSPGKIVTFVQEHGAAAAQILGGVAGAATEALLGLFIFFYAVYVFLLDGPGYYEWFEKHAPIDVEHTRRLAAAFNETGRGLFIGVGLTGLTQGIVATVTYVALGVPRALVLGLLTCISSLIPSVGTGLVWVPVAIGLALAGKTVQAAIMAGVGVLVIATVDNVMRPIFARFGKLELSTFVLLTAIFGGLAMFGTWGLLLGPLCARLAKEALIVARSDRLHEKRAEIDAAREKADGHEHPLVEARTESSR
jgi:predicted PurR-regulated permease PerM